MKGLFATVLIWCAMAVAAFAEPFPRLYDVTGVAADDVLNIRADPSGSSAIIGQLTPQQQNIEVMASDASGKWGLVNVGERSGWVAFRFLHATTGNEDYALAPELSCRGNEPYWSLDVNQGQSAEFSSLTGETKSYPVGKISVGTGRTDRFLLGLGQSSVAVISREMCSDGMSDRDFALRIDLVTSADGQQSLLSGCCSIAPN